MAYINLAGGLKINTADAVDSRLVLTKAEMKSLHYANDESRPTTLRGKIFQLPSNYLCVCSEDNKIYVYNASNEEDALTGKFKKVESDGELYLNIMPYITQTTELNGTITQEGFNLIQTKLDNGEIIGINMDGTLFNYAYFNTYSVDSSAPIKTRIIFLHNAENEIYLKLTIDEALTWSAEPEPISSGSSKIWYDIGNINLFDPQPITQEQYNEMSALAESNGLAGIVLRSDSIAYIPLQNIDNGTFTFQYLSYGKDDFQNFTNDSFTITIKRDLSVSLSLDQKPLFSIPTQGGVFIPCASGAVQQNLTVGDGLKIENGALKTNIPTLPSDASTKTYTLQTVNGALAWTDVIGDINSILDNINGEVI